MSEKKKAKYFCENCGAEVAAKARFCPHCGKFFSAVRCPHCGHTGSVSEFKTGCPVCHYAVTESELRGEAPAHGTSDGLKHKLTGRKKRAINKAFSSYNSRSAAITGDTPVWLLVLSIVLLIGICAVFFIFFNKNI
ncbi:MAG TPA: hypothetical protein DEO40_02280 [Treponema sp.]|nr:zinc ribbon domain-containing protein [Treponema sp.]HBB43391.1 hypothetical protein [Treponema sp.]HCA19487.1 hypothetical protein [Treponema sp.]